MTHARQQIRNAIVAAVTGLSTTGSNVYNSVTDPLDNAKLPAILVTTEIENVEYASIGTAALLEHDLEVSIQAYVKDNSNAENTIDTILSEVQTAIGAASGVQNLVKWILPAEVEIQKQGTAEKIIKVGILSFNCRYMTREGQPDTII